jgi:AcrR family transcriptional regulator
LPKKSPAAPRSSKVAAETELAPVALRMLPEQREKYILEGAIAFFSDVGFSGQTRELSRRLGITQPLLYRYFPSKQVLIDRVFEQVFLGRWNPQWVRLIQDGKVPLRERLIEFYRQYAAVTYQPEWIRLYMYAGLADTGINKRYLELIETEFLSALCIELRRYCGIKKSAAAVSHEEIEFAWSLHGGLFYYAVRHFVFGSSINVDFMSNVALTVDNFLAGVPSTYPSLLSRPSTRTATARRKAKPAGKA